MASGGHILQQQRPNVENRIKALTNPELKEICRDNNSPVSGTKAVLQKRCIDILDAIVRRGDTDAFEDLKFRARVQDTLPLPQNRFSSPSSQHSSSAYQYNMAPQRSGGGLSGRLPTGGKYFKSSPFYEILETLLPLQDLPEMPQNRHTVKATVTIKPDLAQQFRNDNLKILMYCGLSHQMSPFSQVDVAFPNQIEVKVNDQDIKHNFKGLKNKSGSTKPADITSFIRKLNNQQNSIQVTYALTSKRYAYVVYLVRYISADKLTERIKKGNVIPRDRVLRDMSRANADPDIAATSVRMSLKDPISTMRITLPVRASHCTHNQCYDGAMFMQLQEQAPQWSCPVCSKPVSFDSLCVDKYFEDILNRTSRSIEKVDIEPNGDWRVIKEEEDSQPNGTSSKARASYDDDFDDELVEIDQPFSRPVNGVKRESQPSAMLSPATMQAFSINTPPLSSREPSVAQSASSAQRQGSKRPQGAIIDLTISDDDDDPPRPAKRQSTSQHRSHGSQSTSYNTPASLPDHRYQPHQTYNHNHNHAQADNYRPSSNHNNQNLPVTLKLNTANSPSDPQSPMRASPYGQPGWPGRPTPSNNTSGGMFQAPNAPPFQIRPPSHQSASPVGGGSGGPGRGPGGLRLPPMQTHHSSTSPNPYQGGSWRGEYDYGSYSQSPGYDA